MTITKVQAGLWIVFLICYVLSRFLAGSNGYSHAYATQVAITIVLTAILPYYLTRQFATSFQSRALLLTAGLPSLIAMAGYAAFFVGFIAPYNSDITAAAVVIRGLLPGLAVTTILGLPYLVCSADQRGSI